MRYIYILLFFPILLSAQVERPLYVQANLGIHGLQQERAYDYHVYGQGTSFRGNVLQLGRASRGIQAKIGLTYQFFPRWQLSLNTAYAIGSVHDTLDFVNARINDINYSFQHLTKVNTWTWTSDLQLWFRLNRAYDWSIWFGSGLSAGVLNQTYQSGFEYDLDREFYAVERTRQEQRTSLGIPLSVKAQVPISDRIAVGGALQASFFFNGGTQTAITGLIAYRLDRR